MRPPAAPATWSAGSFGRFRCLDQRKPPYQKKRLSRVGRILGTTRRCGGRSRITSKPRGTGGPEKNGEAEGKPCSDGRPQPTRTRLRVLLGYRPAGFGRAEGHASCQQNWVWCHDVVLAAARTSSCGEAHTVVAGAFDEHFVPLCCAWAGMAKASARGLCRTNGPGKFGAFAR